MDDRDRYRGCLVGLAVGDAVGTAVEFRPPGTFEPVTDMTGAILDRMTHLVHPRSQRRKLPAQAVTAATEGPIPNET